MRTQLKEGQEEEKDKEEEEVAVAGRSSVVRLVFSMREVYGIVRIIPLGSASRALAKSLVMRV